MLGVPIVLLPEDAGPLEMIWSLAHELGHAIRHSGPKGSLSYGKEEAQASRWAACALIPYERITAYGNASEDAMVAALGTHYRKVCHTRIAPPAHWPAALARIRLESLAQEVA